MAKVTVTFFEEGSKVKITDGDFKDCTGTVTGVGHHRDPDMLHYVTLDQPKSLIVRSETDLGGGMKTVREENVQHHRVEAKCSVLADA